MKGNDGHLWADDGPSHYIVVELPDGDERMSVESNSLSMILSLAESFSTETPGFMHTLRVVRADTHEAIFRYQEGKGLQEGWVENDPKRADQRRRAYKERKRIIPQG